MAFIGVYRAIYEYEPRAEHELGINEGDLLLVTEKGEDGWWQCKKKAAEEDGDEPEGLCPGAYLEEAKVLRPAKALYDYDRQTDEEISFTEDARLDVYDTSDPDWTLVGFSGEYGFAPANYIEANESVPPSMPLRPQPSDNDASQSYPSPAASPVQSPAAALAGIIQQKTGPTSPVATRSVSSPTQANFTPEASDEEAPPSLPRRPTSQPTSPEPPGVVASPAFDRPEGSGPVSPGYHLYHIHEMVSHQGKNRKMPTTFGINVPRGIIMIAPEKSRDGASKEWTADKLEHYSIEGKHVFIELVRPSKSVDFHAGSKDAAHEIVASLGELAGAARAEGLREVMAATAPTGRKKGVMLYEFMAQGDDEVTVATGDEIIILDDTQSTDWWSIRRLKNGKEGVVPSSYVEVTGTTASAPEPSGLSQKELNRIEEERLARDALRSSSSKGQEVGTGLSLPNRQSSLGQYDGDKSHKSQRSSKSGSRSEPKSSGSKPDPARVRTWTDRTGSFKVDAQFIGLKDGKINLHKVNGIKIAVVVSKMSIADIEFVEQATGTSLDDEKPLSDIKRRNHIKADQAATGSASSPTGAALKPSDKPEYDWFDFFLQCGVNPQICERYAGAFAKDQMGEENMQDIDPTLLRTLGLKEGDILRVMKHLDSKYGRARASPSPANGDASANDAGGLFSGPGGALRNNTRKGRPAPALQSNQTVDPRAFEQSKLKELPPDPSPSPLGGDRPPPAPEKPGRSGFDDNAWDVKPSKIETPPRNLSPAVLAPQPKSVAPTSALSELTLLSPPLKPESAPPPAAPTQPSKPPGADPLFFDTLVQSSSTSAARQRPQALQQAQSQNSMLPPSQASLTAPQNQGGFGQPSLQFTGNQSLAPPGRSMNEMSQQRMQQQYGQMYPQQTGFTNGMMPQQTGFQQYPPGYGQQFQPQPTGYQQAFINGQQAGSPFADPHLQPQPTGFQPQRTGINSMLLPPLQPQPTGVNGYSNQQQPQFQNNFQSNATGFGQNGQGFNPPPVQQQSLPQLPPMPQPQQSTPAPLQPQKTGPAPPVKFGVTASEQKLVPQPTGRRANLAAATPQNPFGF